MAIPTEQKALVVQEGQKVKVEKISVPKLTKDDEILVKVEAAAQNPTDWKHVVFKMAGPGKVVGCDIAGTVVDGKGKSLIGKRVAACVHGGWENGNGGYQEYVKIDKALTIALPDNLSFEEGAALPLATITACLVIFQQLGFPLPGEGKKNVPFLVWGGASSVGMYAIQFAALAGATVIATASKDNHELLKSLGAKYTFDYKDSDVIDQIKKAAGGEVEYGIDCVSLPETVGQGAKAYSSKGKVGLILPVDKAKSGDSIEHKNVIMYTIFNHDFSMGPSHVKADPTDHIFATKMYKIIGDLIASGQLKPNPLKKYPDGLSSVEQGFQDAQSNKIRAAKAIYRISDTKQYHKISLDIME